jgi:hypothetical protein
VVEVWAVTVNVSRVKLAVSEKSSYTVNEVDTAAELLSVLGPVTLHPLKP